MYPTLCAVRLLQRSGEAHSQSSSLCPATSAYPCSTSIHSHSTQVTQSYGFPYSLTSWSQALFQATRLLDQAPSGRFGVHTAWRHSAFLSICAWCPFLRKECVKVWYYLSICSPPLYPAVRKHYDSSRSESFLCYRPSFETQSDSRHILEFA